MLINVLKLTFVVVFLSSTGAGGEYDWPQWRGPQRDGYAASQKLMQEWPTAGPPLKWKISTAGRGYSSLAVVDDRMFTLGADEQDCFALCHDVNSGKQIWKTTVSRSGKNADYNGGWGSGPRSTPTIDGDQVFVQTDVGVVAALNRQTGELQWSVDLVKKYGGDIPKWGYSESPLIDENRVIVQPGGTNYMVGLDRQSGELIWQSKGAEAAAHYVSAMKGQIGNVSYYVTATNIGVIAFDCQTGEKLFENKATGNDVATVPTPLIVGDLVYHTSNYGAGNVLLKLQSSNNTVEAEQMYYLNGKTMTNHHGGVVHVDGVVYGFTKVNGGVWMAQDLLSGDTLWEQRIGRNRSGSICFGDGRLYCYNDEDGSVVLVEPSRDGWKPRGELKIPSQTSMQRGQGAIWAHPIIANQMLLIRDQDLVFAFDLKP